MMPLEIKGARTRLGLTQREMAEKLKISVHSYQKKETGKIPFTETQKFEVSKILGLSLVQMNDFLFDHQLPIGTEQEILRKYKVSNMNGTMFHPDVQSNHLGNSIAESEVKENGT